MRRVIFYKNAVLIQCLLYGNVGTGMLQFRRKRDRTGTCYRGKVFSQVGSKIHDHLPCRLRILVAEAVYTCHGVINEVRPHLQHHNAGALIGNLRLLSGNLCLLSGVFLLPSDFLLYLIRHDKTIHGQSGEDDAAVQKQESISEKQHSQSYRKRHYGDKETKIGFSGETLPVFYSPCKIQQHDNYQRQDQKRIRSFTIILSVRCHISESADKRRSHNHCHIDPP